MLTFCCSLALSASVVAQERGAGRPGDDSGERPQRSVESIVSHAWWNLEKMHTELGLTEAQRSKADAVLTKFLEQERPRQELVRDSQKAYFDALLEGKGDMQPLIDKMAAATADNAKANAELRVSVMALFTAEQRAKIKDKYPMLVRRSWANGGQMMMPMRSPTAGRMTPGPRFQRRPTDGTKAPAGSKPPGR